jgi:ATP-dependent DNA ligase
VKFDGYRVQAHKIGTDVAIFSHNAHDFTSRFADEGFDQSRFKPPLLHGALCADTNSTRLRSSRAS